MLRKRGRQCCVSLDDADSLLQIADEFTVEGDFLEDELRREVLNAIKLFGEPDSSIIIRKYYFGESSKEIADALKMTVSNVDTRTCRALNKLRKMFGGKEDEKEFE